MKVPSSESEWLAVSKDFEQLYLVNSILGRILKQSCSGFIVSRYC